jgi:RNA polymerase subunit RPABC4/transcription elongation factor Spt4
MNLLQSQQQSKATSQRHLYPAKQLAILAIASVLSLLLIAGNLAFQSILGGPSGPLAIIGITIYLLVITIISLCDWRGFFTMNGLLKWKSITNKQRLIAGCLFVTLNAFVLGLYFAQAYLTYRRYKQSEPLRRRRKIAEQEAELGMIPQTDGNCHKCHQPLQLGAEFCAYCGERVTPRPRICPECYTTTLPDARWCPACGAQLDTTALSHSK